jgi:hypothetical protein
MAQNLSTAFVTLFDAEVKQAYQASAVLRPAVRIRSGVEGSTYKFPKIGKGVAQVRIPQTDITPLNVTYSQVTATLSDYIAAEYSDVTSSFTLVRWLRCCLKPLLPRLTLTLSRRWFRVKSTRSSASPSTFLATALRVA